jgi:tape measure domain-containing protein
MATEETVVLVSERGASDVAKKVRDIGTAGEQSAKSIDTLKGVLATIGGVLAVDKLKEASDAYLGINNRLKLVTKGADDLAKTQQRLLDISNDTRSSFEGTAALYTKLSLNAKNLNISQEDVAKVVERTNKAIVLSGASANEAKGGLIQFSQGLASGRLQGEELRSVLENLPALAQQIAKGLNTTVDNLRKLGAAGSLTTSAVLGALKRQGDEIDKAFKSFTPTIGQALEVLNNQFITFVGNAGQTSGAANLIASSILTLANNLGTASNIVLTFGAAFATLKIATFIQGIYTATTAVGFFNAILSVNPIVAFAVALVGVTTALLTFGSSIKLTADGTVTLATVTKTALNQVGQSLLTLAQYAITVGTSIITVLTDTFNFVANGFNTAYNTVSGWVTKVKTLFTDIGNFIKTTFDGVIAYINGLWQSVLNTISSVLQRVGDVANKIVSVGKANAQGGGNLAKSLPGFATGGSFTVGGSGGTDSQLVAFRATPGEKVSINTPGQSGGNFQITTAFAGPESQKTFQTVLSSGKTESTFNDAVKSGTSDGFKTLNSTTAALSTDVTTGNNKLISQTVAYGGQITGVVNASSKSTSAGLSTVRAGTDATTESVDRLTGVVAASGGIGGSDGGGTSFNTGGGGSDFNKPLLGNTQGSGGFSSGGGGGGSFTITVTPPFQQWLQNLGGVAVKGALQGFQQDVYQYVKLLERPIDNQGAIAASRKNLARKVAVYKNDPQFNLAFGSLANELLKFRNGGSVMVGGTGAVDSTYLAMRATKGERIDVLTPAQQQEERKQMQAGSQRPINVEINITTPDANSFRKSKTQVLQQFVVDLQRSLNNV